MTNCNSTNGRCPTLNRKSFMAELRSLLAFLDAAERDRVLNRYERMFDEAGPEGETTVVRCFGSPVRQVLQIEREYREAVANGETPFADGEAAGPEETEAPEETEIIEEEYTGAHIRAEESEPEAEEPLPEDLPEELIEELPEELPEPEPEEEIAAEPEIDLDELDFSDLGLTFTKKPAAPVMPAAPEEEPEEEAGETPDGSAKDEEPLPLEPLYPEEVLPDDEPRRIESADEILDALLADAAAELLPEEEADKPAPPDAEEPAGEPADVAAEETADEAPAEPEPEMSEPEEPETPDGAEDVSEILPAEESFPEEAEEAAEAEEPAEEPEAEEEYEYEEIETRRPVSGGRAFAAVVVTIPMLAVWVLMFGLSLALGIAVLGIGAALLAAGVYLTGYVFNGAIVRMPDLLLTAGATLAAFALALLLLWTGISIAVAGCTLTVRLTRSIYRAILYPKKGEDADE